MTPVRIATRRSELALWQANFVARQIESRLGRTTQLVPLSTRGDRQAAEGRAQRGEAERRSNGIAGSVATQGGKGLFVREIQEALLDGRADVAVHSAKDLPVEAPDELCIAAFPERADPRDALVTRAAADLAALPTGARVGTGSLRRGAQLLRLRPDLRIVALRGNVPTRLAALERDGLDAVVVACAGLDRLGLADRIRERIDPQQLLPAVGQGALAVQARRGDALAGALAALGDPTTATQLAAERACQQRLGADCNVPLAAYAELDGAGAVALRLRLLAADGSEQIECCASAPERSAAALGRDLAEQALASGGAELLARLRAQGAA